MPLKRTAVAEGLYQTPEAPDLANSFIGFVERYGRSFEFGLATRHTLAHRPLDTDRRHGRHPSAHARSVG